MAIVGFPGVYRVSAMVFGGRILFNEISILFNVVFVFLVFLCPGDRQRDSCVCLLRYRVFVWLSQSASVAM